MASTQQLFERRRQRNRTQLRKKSAGRPRLSQGGNALEPAEPETGRQLGSTARRGRVASTGGGAVQNEALQLHAHQHQVGGVAVEHGVQRKARVAGNRTHDQVMPAEGDR